MRYQHLIGLAAALSVTGCGLFLHSNPSDIYDGIMCDSDMECEEATGYPYDTAMRADAPKYPVLVGIDCKGAGGPLYAFEEDHFPEGGCREIWPMDWDWQEKLP